jgi:hypothetical protein
MDMGFAVICPLARHLMPQIRFLYIGSYVCSTLLSDPPSPERPCASLSLRLHQATLLLDANVDIVKVKDLLGHRHITTTQIYDKRRRSTSESASHLLAI